MDIISECKLSIHDISNTELDKVNNLPRFNMPLELGLFLGAKEFGSGNQKSKECLILDRERYRYQKYCSDISGQDIKSHENDLQTLVKRVRDWLKGYKKEEMLPGGHKIHERYLEFQENLPVICDSLTLKEEDLTFIDFLEISTSWLKENSW